MWDLIAFGGMIFWGLFALLIVAEFFCVQNETFGRTILPFSLMLILCFVVSKSELLPWLGSHWMWFLLYIPVGIFWASLKWINLSKGRGEIYADTLADFGESHLDGHPVTSVKDIPKAHLHDFFEIVEDHLNSSQYGHAGFNTPRENAFTVNSQADVDLIIKSILGKIMPRPKDYVERISVWFTWWPFNLLNFFLYDFMKAMGKKIVKWLNGWLLRLSKMVMRSQSKDFDDVK